MGRCHESGGCRRWAAEPIAPRESSPLTDRESRKWHTLGTASGAYLPWANRVERAKTPVTSAAEAAANNATSGAPLPLSPTFPDAGEQYTGGKASGSAAPLVSAVGQTYHFTPLSFAENMAAMVLFGLIIAPAARSQLKVEKS
jgi:hypothetical protein